MYLFYYIVVGIGCGMLIWGTANVRKLYERISKILAAAITVVVLLNVMLSGAAITKFSILPDTRVSAMAYCSENGISRENSIYEGYTPFAPNEVFNRVKAFVVTEGGIQIKQDYAGKKYFVMSNSFRDRFMAEAEKYPSQSEVYSKIDDSFELIYQENGNNYSQQMSAVKNIFYSLQYLTEHVDATGNTIYIYDLGAN